MKALLAKLYTLGLIIFTCILMVISVGCGGDGATTESSIPPPTHLKDKEIEKIELLLDGKERESLIFGKAYKVNLKIYTKDNQIRNKD